MLASAGGYNLLICLGIILATIIILLIALMVRKLSNSSRQPDLSQPLYINNHLEFTTNEEPTSEYKIFLTMKEGFISLEITLQIGLGKYQCPASIDYPCTTVNVL
jgi:hypothetical protein